MLLIDDLEALESSRVQQQLVYDLEDSGVCGNDSSLQFDSRFECGNLRQAYQVEHAVLTLGIALADLPCRCLEQPMTSF
jgi:hypothetical protein